MDWVEQAGMEAAEEDRVMEEERWKTVQLMGVVDNLYSERDVLIHHIVHHEAAWAARTGRVVVMARERARVNEVDLRISSAVLMIKQRQEEVHPIQYQEAWCEPSPPVPSPTSGLSPVPSGPSPESLLPPQSSAVSSQAPSASQMPSQQSQQVRGEEEASRKVDDEQRESEKRESEKKENEKREEDGKKEEPPQQKEHDPSKAKGEPELMDLFGAGGEGAGQQQLLRRQQRQQQQSQAKEGRAADLSAASREEVQRYDDVERDREYLEDREDGKVVDGGDSYTDAG